MKSTIAQASEEYLKLRGYIAQQKPGAVLTYKGIEKATGIKMDMGGKAKLKRAIDRSGIECSALRNTGYRLADHTIAMPILVYRLRRVDKQAKRAARAQHIIQGAFFADLTPDEQRGVLFLGAVFGAIRVAAENGKALYGPSPKALPAPDNIPVPQLKP